ncbi:uncharacterized protein LOC119784069 [Cyprinodon tularosa]|uniref:uncharacterized protein LOC119784069 n=1 Tax=Cyprinodon tularosa TaxID=77115 RepID=UPI0018E21F23|nr:uncharacterized protein LOC119784069 [Cyprinodon tularosa]
MEANVVNRGRARGVRVRGGRWGGRGRGRGRGRPRTIMSDEFRATLVDHVYSHYKTAVLHINTVLNENKLRIKQVYRVPFERNSERVKELRYNYVQRVLELEVDAVEHQFFFIDEVGFNLTKRRRRGRNIIGQRAIVEVPGQHGGNITMCAAMTHHGIIHHHATLGPYNTAHLITFLDTLHNTLIPPDQIDGPEQLRYVVIWDNVSFHRAALVH